MDSQRRPAAIYPEGIADALDDPSAMSPGYLAPLEEWDAEMNRVIGTAWDRENEPVPLKRARRGRGKCP